MTTTTEELDIRQVPVNDLSISTHNKRPKPKKSDPGIKELAATIKENGVLLPLLARHETGGEVHLIAGARRLVAAAIAGLTHVPVRFIEVDDDQFLRLMFIENNQREDLDPLDESKLVEEYLKVFKMDYTTVAAHFGKTEQWVAKCVKLLDLSTLGCKMLKNGAIPLATALEIARLPEDTQDELLDDQYGDDAYELATGDVKAIRSMIESRTMVLSAAPWDLDTFENRPICQSCTSCEFRSGHQPALWSEFSDNKKATDRCLAPERFGKKMEAHLAAVAKSLNNAHDHKLLYISEQTYTRESSFYGIPIEWKDKVYGSSLYKTCKKGSKDSRVALWVDGPKKGRSEFVQLILSTTAKTKAPAKAVKEMNHTEAVEKLSERNDTLEDKRFCNVIDQLVVAIEAAKEPKFGLWKDVPDFWLRHVCVFGGYSAHDSGFDQTWKELDSWDISNESKEMWDTLRDIFISRLKYQVMKEMKKKKAMEVKRIAVYIGFDLKAAAKKAIEECPEPKSWGALKLKANGSKLQPKKEKK